MTDVAGANAGSGAMFDRIATKYDRLNRIISFGMDQGWRVRLVRALELAESPKVLDVATGTADVAIAIADTHPDAQVVGLDPSLNMLEVGKQKIARFEGRIELVAGDAQQLPFADGTFDGACISFGIRNVPDRAKGLAEMRRVVKPGGRVVVLEARRAARRSGELLCAPACASHRAAPRRLSVTCPRVPLPAALDRCLPFSFRVRRHDARCRFARGACATSRLWRSAHLFWRGMSPKRGTPIDALRLDYARGMLDESDVDPDPIGQFIVWLDQAIAAKAREPTGMTVATIDADGTPSARIALLKNIDQRGFVFFTSYDSRKGRAIAANAKVALVFWWPELERQARIEGVAAKVDTGETEIYFASRPRTSQLGAWASPQSSPVRDRDELDKRYANVSAQFSDGAIPPPPSWGGYRVTPSRIELWQGRPSRMHDRIVYERHGTGWRTSRLAP